jgi:hypothetical protein
MTNDSYDTRPIRPAHVPAPTSSFDPTQFDASNRIFVSKFAVAFFLLGVAAIIVMIVR